MEGQEAMVGVRDVGGAVTSISDEFDRLVSVVRESENLIQDRLTISRMVSDSVIKGMVKAVEQVAEEKIAAKELEVAGLKEERLLHFHQLGADKSESSSGSPAAYHVPRSKGNRLYCCFSNALEVEHNKMKESVGSLRSVARGCSSMRKISSGSELVQANASESLLGVDKRLDTLKTTLDSICTQVDDIVCLGKASLCEWQQEQEFQRELEAMVIQSSIRSLLEEFEEKLRDQNALLCGSQSMNWLINEVSSLRKELDVILKSLSHSETGQLLISHGSHDMDHLSNHVLPATLLGDGNGVFEESSKNDMPENWEAAQLKHLTKEELVNYFNTVITKMKRNHETKVQEMTEENFSLKREYLKIKEKGSLPLRKDKDLDILRKKIPEVILKLDGILVENEKFSTFTESLGSLKDRLNSLSSENRQLRESLADKQKEVKCLSSQVSDASKKMLLHSSTDPNLLKSTRNLESAAKHAEIEAFVSEEVYKCVLREVTAQINCDTEELEVQSIVMQEVFENFYREAAEDAEATSKCEIGDSDIESLFMQGLSGIIFGEVIRDAQSQINEESRLMIEEKESLKQEVLLLEALLKEKEKLALEQLAALAKEKERFELASQESNNLKVLASCLKTLVSERSKELDLIKGELAEAREQIDVDKVEIKKLNQKLELKTNELREADEQRNFLLAVIHGLSQALSKALSDFERQAAEGIKKNNLRLKESSSQLSSLIQKTNELKRTTSSYKQILKGKCDDLQKAESEVDLLGDQVDALLSILEKIYIALDHYSPILQHYPGIIEILKLVRRELSGESTKAVLLSSGQGNVSVEDENRVH